MTCLPCKWKRTCNCKSQSQLEAVEVWCRYITFFLLSQFLYYETIYHIKLRHSHQRMILREDCIFPPYSQLNKEIKVFFLPSVVFCPLSSSCQSCFLYDCSFCCLSYFDISELTYEGSNVLPFKKEELDTKLIQEY